MATPDLLNLPPMLPCTQPLPFSHDEWLAELKFDGYRVMAATADEGARLQTKRGIDCTSWFPEVVSALSELPAGHVFDGEICVMDRLGHCNFEQVRARALHGGTFTGCDPVVFCVFDQLFDRGHDLRAWPLLDRKDRLKRAIAGAEPALMIVEGLPGDGHWLWRKAEELMLEGIVLKRLDSVYQPGALSMDWVAVSRPGSASERRKARGRASLSA
ncbi:MAG: hypothetical protein EOP40_04725 [Rubrivivax sp.]|nr:MAG: hypothetical protein EOP40_04725 [Rubrivivax sp.]